MTWDQENAWESKWWGNCANTIGEKLKQFVYFAKMGISWEIDAYDGSRVWLKIKNLSVLDIGGGPDSALLQTRFVKGVVVDPCEYPQWTKDRYAAAGIKMLQIKAEDIDISDPDMKFDECWMYNCLQHVESPDMIAEKALAVSKIVRVCEPVNIPVSAGHPHMLTKEWLDRIFKGNGTVESLRENGFVADAYFGAFKGNL